MNKSDFLALLEEKQIAQNLIHFENSVSDGYYVLKNRLRWEVFFRERGMDCDCMGFPTESEALAYLAERLIANG